LGITIWSSTYDVTIDVNNKDMLFSLKVVQAISVIIVFILPACLFVLFFSPEKLHYFSLNRSPSFIFVIISCLLIISAMPFITYLEGLNKAMSLPEAFSGIEQWMRTSELKVQEIEEALMKDQTPAGLIMNVFVIGFMAALSEELFFRGLVQRAMLNMSKKVHLSVWVTAVLFSAFHMQFYGFLPRVLLGAILGYIYVWSGSLWTNIIVHFLNNALILVLTYLVSTGVLPKTVEDIGMESDKVTLTWALPSLVLIIVGMFLLNKMKRPMQLTG
jgi:membrane protease YdiL (CAAX protease family)